MVHIDLFPNPTDLSHRHGNRACVSASLSLFGFSLPEIRTVRLLLLHSIVFNSPCRLPRSPFLCAMNALLSALKLTFHNQCKDWVGWQRNSSTKIIIIVYPALATCLVLCTLHTLSHLSFITPCGTYYHCHYFIGGEANLSPKVSLVEK